ncbi:MAG TPA: hypothetical protein VI796_00170 [Candidatus Thermoplasmatota archaeon]|nr:hypothetical protein [Candidatus Thermoplasmatota archaeon]
MELSDSLRAPASSPRLVASALLLFLLAIVLARLLIQDLWQLFLLALPVALLLFSLLLGVRLALLLSVLLAGGALALRAYLEATHSVWPALLLMPVVAFTLFLASRVVVAMRDGRRPPEEG